MTRKRTGTRAGTAAPGLALVTGASAGIGREMARVFARHGHDLVIVARRRDRLLELKRELERDHAVRVRVVEADLADPAAPAAIRRSLARRQVEILVNNAGTLEGGADVAQGLACLGGGVPGSHDAAVVAGRGGAGHPDVGPDTDRSGIADPILPG